jgi:hypothetical protein
MLVLIAFAGLVRRRRALATIALLGLARTSWPAVGSWHARYSVWIFSRGASMISLCQGARVRTDI